MEGERGKEGNLYEDVIELRMAKDIRCSVLWDLLMGLPTGISVLWQAFIQPFLYENTH